MWPDNGLASLALRCYTVIYKPFHAFFLSTDICLRNLSTLERAGLTRMDDGFDLKPTGITDIIRNCRWLVQLFIKMWNLNQASSCSLIWFSSMDCFVLLIMLNSWLSKCNRGISKLKRYFVFSLKTSAENWRCRCYDMTEETGWRPSPCYRSCNLLSRDSVYCQAIISCTLNHTSHPLKYSK